MQLPHASNLIGVPTELYMQRRLGLHFSRSLDREGFDLLTTHAQCTWFGSDQMFVSTKKSNACIVLLSLDACLRVTHRVPCFIRRRGCRGGHTKGLVHLRASRTHAKLIFVTWSVLAFDLDRPPPPPPPPPPRVLTHRKLRF